MMVSPYRRSSSFATMMFPSLLYDSVSSHRGWMKAGEEKAHLAVQSPLIQPIPHTPILSDFQTLPIHTPTRRKTMSTRTSMNHPRLLPPLRLLRNFLEDR